MGNRTTKQEQPMKSNEEIMKERWMKLAESNKKNNPPEVVKQEDQTNKINQVNEQINVLKIKENISSKIEDNSIVLNERIDIKQIIEPVNNTQPMIIDGNPKESNIISTPTLIESNNNLVQNLSCEKKIIDKEHSTIEKIFRISLQPSNKFLHLSLYQAQLMSDSREELFRLSELDNIMLSIINESDIKKKIIYYLLESYHRSIEMIERRFKHEYDEKYQQIRKMIASYLSLIIYSPENFEMEISKIETISILTKYYNETDEEELLFLISDIIIATQDDFQFLKQVFSYLLNIIHMDNITAKNNFFNCDRIKRNVGILTKIMNDFPITRQAYITEANFLPSGINGRSFQTSTYLGVYLNLVSFESDVNQIRNSFTSIHQAESDNQVKSYSNKLNNLMTEITNLFYLLIENQTTRESTLSYFCVLVNSNFDRTKMYANPLTTSSIGFLLNVTIVLLKLFFETASSNNFKCHNSVLEIIEKIDIMYCVSTTQINFNKFDRINPSLVKEVLSSEHEKVNERCMSGEINITTKIFFFIHNILSFFVKHLDEEYTKVAQQLNEMYRSNMINDPRFRELLGMVRSVDVYFRYPEFMTNLMKFNEVTCILLFVLNNKKYNSHNISKFDLSDFLNDFYENLETSNFVNLSILPLHIVKNIMNTSLLIRKFYSEALLLDMECTKLIVYFAIIYSSQVDLIHNPHLRSEIFDILLYFFNSNPQERNSKQNAQLLKILNDEFVKENLIYSLMRVFIDAERLGTSNQFYEKFSIRNKILYLIENLMKTHKSIYSDKFLDFANKFRFDTIKMINLLMNDLTFLIDECIERLMQIKKFQDLRADVERYNALDEETKQLETDKFNDNDQRVRTELKLFNSSMNFMVIICQFCQDNFMSLKLSERLANLLNYSLDVFTSKKNLKLKINNMSEYGFDPKNILNSIITIYLSFKDYKEFLEFLVLDERSFKIENFERVIVLKEDGKFPLEYNCFLDFKSLVENLRLIDSDIKSKQINYDDAPEEYLDQITTVLMEDPVRLPSSNMILDRTTIETHLLSDPTDPFNRTKLSKEELISCPELKQKVLDYKQSKLNEKLNNKI